MSAPRISLEYLPPDVLWIIVRQGLNLLDLARLAQTCRVLHRFVEDYGWKVYSITYPEPIPSLTPALISSKWTIRDLLRHQTLAIRAWKARSFIIRPLGPEWTTKYHPVLAISPSRLVVAPGNSLFLYKFAPPYQRHVEQPRVVFERLVTFPQDARKDFTGVSFVGSGDSDLLLSFANGALAHMQLPASFEAAKNRKITVEATAIRYIRNGGPMIRALSTAGTTALTLDSTGTVSLYSLAGEPTRSPVSTMELGSAASPVIGWSALLSLQTRLGYAVVGTASPAPLVVYNITESHFSPLSKTILSPSIEYPSPSCPAAVYSICGATETFPSISPCSQIVISGWYHGAILVHDLRCPTHIARGEEGRVLSPALALRDPVVSSPIYSVSSAGNHIAGGSALHSLVHLYDVRFPRTGWSIYLPQPRRGHSSSSPVYSCLLESTRLWTATESRAFVVEFGRGYCERTYPSSGHHSGSSYSGAAGYPATYYEHDLFSGPRSNGWRTGLVNTIA